MTSDADNTWTVTLRAADGTTVSFAASAANSIVKSAARAGIRLTTGCLQGRCAICRARPLAGNFRLLRKLSKHAVASPLERADGCVLPCSIAPTSDVALEPLSPWESDA